MTTTSNITVGTTAGREPPLAAGPAGTAGTPEFTLLATCCRWPPSPSRHAAIAAAATDVVDWNAFLWQVNRHRIAGLVHDALAKAGVELPAAIGEQLTAQAQRIVRRNLSHAIETARLQQAFAGANIPVLALKGVALAQLAYGSLETKDSRDIDLLIPPDRVEAALAILESEGYALSHPAGPLNASQRRAVFRYAREVQLLHRSKNIGLELQWQAATNPLLLEGIDARSPAQDVAVAERMSIRTLAPQELFSYLCVHGAQHAWSRLKWLADLNAVIAADGADITQLHRQAQSVGAGICAGQALLLCHRLFGTGLPAALLAELEANRTLARLLLIAEQTMADERAEADAARSVAATTRVVRGQFLLGKGPAFLAAQCRAEAVRILDIIDLPLPPSLHFLYPFLRVPLWLWRLAGSGRPLHR